jgi:soluble lytic murein transglycosylase-like protein
MPRLAFGLFVCGLPLLAGEFAVLSSGLRIRADSHVVDGVVVRLFRKDGVTELPATVVASFEPDDFEPAAPPPAPAPVLLPVPTVQANHNDDPKTLLRRAAARSGLPPAFVESVARVESGFRPDAVSPKGAIGVMQLMPETARGLGADPRNLEQNIDAGTRLLRDLLLKYDGDVVKALAAYNAGSGAVDRFGGLPPFQETRSYVNKVIGAYRKSSGGPR